MGKTPLVSVLMPVYNGMPYLPLAVESILHQSFRDFEFIIVDDCSTDDSLNYLNSISDERMVLVKLSQNKGVTGALQEGMARVRGKYVARLDADDVAKPYRLQTQVEYMENNTEVGLLGSNFELIDSSGKFLQHARIEKSDVEIRWKILFKNPFVHSTVMFRNNLLKDHQLGYTLQHAEDYQLWVELIKLCNAEIIRDELIQYRTHQQSWTFTKEDKQIGASLLIGVNQLKRLVDEKDHKLSEFIKWVRGRGASSDEPEMGLIYLKILKAFLKNNIARVNAKFFIKQVQLMRRRFGARFYFRVKTIELFFYFFQVKLKWVYQLLEEKGILGFIQSLKFSPKHRQAGSSC